MVGDEEGVGMRVGPESELQHVGLWAQQPVDGAERTAGRGVLGASICGLGLGVEGWKENTES